MVVCYKSPISIGCKHFGNDTFVLTRRVDVRVGSVSTKQLLYPMSTLSHTPQFPAFYFRRSLHSHLTARRTLHFEHSDDMVVMPFRGVVEARFPPVVYNACVALLVQQKFHNDWRTQAQAQALYA